MSTTGRRTVTGSGCSNGLGCRGGSASAGIFVTVTVRHKVVYVPLDDIVGADRNPKRHALDELGRSIDRFDCVEHGGRAGWRIAVSGYDDDFVLPGWRCVRWMARRSMGRASGATRNTANRQRERVWFSPGCVGGLGG